MNVKTGRVSFDGFDWDSGNTRKAQKHGLGLDEIEAFFGQELLVIDDGPHSRTEERLIAVGRSPEGRPMFVAFTLRQKPAGKLIRVISARYAHEKEHKAYEILQKRLRDEDR